MSTSTGEARSAATADPALLAGDLGLLPAGRRRRVAGRSALICLAVLAACVLAGHVWGNRWFAGLVEPARPMKVNTAACLALFAVAAALASLLPRIRLLVQLPVGALVAAVGGLTLWENASGRSLGIDERLLRDTWSPEGLAPGRAAVPACMGLLLLGLALLVPRRWRPVTQVITISVVGLGLLGLLGRALDLEDFLGIPGTYAIPLSTSISLVLGAVGFSLASGPPRPTESMAMGSPSGLARRRLLPFVVLLPIVAASANEFLERAGLLSERASATVTLFMVTIAVVAGWRACVLVNALFRERLRDKVRREQDQRYLDLFDSIPEGLYETRLDGTFVTVNDPGARMLGYHDSAHLLAEVQRVQDLWVDLESRDVLLARVRGGETSGTTDVRLRRRDGAALTVELSFRAVLTGAGEVRGLRGTVRDVTVARARQAHYEEMQERYRLAFEHAPLGRLVLDLGARPSRFVEVNRALAELLGYTVAEILGMDPTDFLHPDDALAEEATMQRCIRGELDSVSYDTHRRHRSGDWIPVRLTGALTWENGKPRYAMATIEDLRPRLRAEAELVAARALAEDRARRAGALNSLAAAILSDRAPDDLQADVVRQVVDVLEADLAVVYECAAGSQVWRVTAHQGVDDRDPRLAAHGPSGDSPIIAAAIDDRTWIVDDWTERPADALPAQLGASGVRSTVTVPIGHDGTATLTVAARHHRPFTGPEVAFLEGVADLLGIARAKHSTRRRLVRSEQILDALVENAPAAVYLFDPDGRCILANREVERIVGRPRSEIVGHTRAEFWPDDFGDVQRRNDLDVLSGAGSKMFEEFAQEADGEHAFLSVKFPLIGEDGKPFVVGGISTDVTLMKRLERERDRAWRETLRRIAVAVEYRDQETGAHIERVGAYCEVIGRHLGLDEEHLELLRAAAPLHDAGKIAVPDAILLKPGPLTGAERRIMERHCEVGYDLLHGTGTPVLEMAATIAYTHHERMDGNGYPRRLRGSQIPLEGRIAAVADVFDALTTDRVYRRAMTLEDAVAILRQGRGTHFDPAALDAFLDSLDEVLEVSRRYDADGGVAGRRARSSIGPGHVPAARAGD